MYDEWIDDYIDDDFPTYFSGTCTCLHEETEHDWGGCYVEDTLGNECACEAGWEE